jgi:hypothetical protein
MLFNVPDVHHFWMPSIKPETGSIKAVRNGRRTEQKLFPALQKLWQNSGRDTLRRNGKHEQAE